MIEYINAKIKLYKARKAIRKEEKTIIYLVKKMDVDTLITWMEALEELQQYEKLALILKYVKVHRKDAYTLFIGKNTTTVKTL